MNKNDVIAFFDRLAPGWDADVIRSDVIISKILDGAQVQEYKDVLDVACGTGVLFPDYLARNVNSLTAIDIAPEMVKIAKGKFPEVTVLCGDVEHMAFDRNRQNLQ
jgi:demethylmenaquinone methyltransferase/2-methoxy-6-polyprenyl-1,4-benzoquinol methylase